MAVQGTGMGLAIGKAIVEAHGGTLESQVNWDTGLCSTSTYPSLDQMADPSKLYSNTIRTKVAMQT